MKNDSVSGADIQTENNFFGELVLEVLEGIQMKRKQFTKIRLFEKVKLSLLLQFFF